MNESPQQRGQERLLLVGAGQAGRSVVRSVLKGEMVGFVDDKAGNTDLDGVVRLGDLSQIDRICRRHRINSIIIAIENLSRETIWRIVDQINFATTTVRTIPAPSEEPSTANDGNPMLRPLLPEDLVGRRRIPIDLRAICSQLKQKSILITGAGGSIGSELARQLLQLPIKKLVCLCRSEYSLYKLQGGMEDKNENALPVRYFLGDIRDEERMEELFSEEKPQIAFHAAAHKHVLFMEENEKEALKVNVFGTQNVLKSGLRHGLEQFVFISTDKAVNPTSIMGVSKRLAEGLVRSYSGRGGLKADVVRFGNVLSSRGSVVPLFKRQISKGGPITVTHPRAVRYFMTLREAALLVINATVLSTDGGDTFFLNMGESIEIDALVRRMAWVQGLAVGRDIDIEYTGLRTGEKVVEQLITENENALPTTNSKIRKLQRHALDEKGVRRSIDSLKSRLPSLNSRNVRAFLATLVPEYKPVRQKSIQKRAKNRL